MSNIFELADELKNLKKNKKELENETKLITDQINQIEQQLVESMIDQEMQNFSRGGTLFYLNTRFHASPVPEKKEELYQTLKEQGFSDLVKETVNSRTLDGFVKEQKELNDDEIPNWLNGLVNPYEENCIGMRKTK